MSKYTLTNFPPEQPLETAEVLRALVKAHRYLAELKGMARTIPNEGLLVSALSLQEAQSSSKIENIITTQDALYKYQLQPDAADPVSKEVVRMALIHHQFESIHPFYDGNGRTGRIINILYLVKESLLDAPILYLSRYISQTKGQYYTSLQKVRDTNEWQQWIVYILEGIAITAQQANSGCKCTTH